MKDILKIIKDFWNRKQDEPEQYVVVYKRVDDDSIIGYHLSTFCTLTDDILQAKRYSGANPYLQLETILGNLVSIIKGVDKDHLFFDAIEQIRNNYYNGLKIEDIYLDAEYLTDGTPKQECRINIIDLQ